MNAHSFSNRWAFKLSRKSSTLIDRKQNGKISYVFDLLCILVNSDAFS